jgi:hypothetical protein
VVGAVVGATVIKKRGGFAHPPVPFLKTRPSVAQGNRQAVREFIQLLIHIRQGPSLTSE